MAEGYWKLPMDAREKLTASNALMQWFMSQAINPSDGVEIMISTIATQIRPLSDDERKIMLEQIIDSLVDEIDENNS